MDRITGNTIDLGGGRRGFRDRNLAVGLAGTFHNAAYHNGVQEELLAVIEAAGLTPDDENLTQVLTALRAMLAPRMWVFSSSGTFVVPAGITRVRLSLWAAGGGGGGASSAPNSVGAAGGGGGFAYGAYEVTPGASYAVTVGAGGSNGVGGSSPTGGGAGGSSSFGSLLSATGGAGGLAADGAVQSGAGAGGVGTGGQLNISGTPGGLAYPLGGGTFVLAQGGAAHRGNFTPTVSTGGAANGAGGVFPGGGASGGALSGSGGGGASGLVIVEA